MPPFKVSQGDAKKGCLFAVLRFETALFAYPYGYGRTKRYKTLCKNCRSRSFSGLLKISLGVPCWAMDP